VDKTILSASHLRRNWQRARFRAGLGLDPKLLAAVAGGHSMHMHATIQMLSFGVTPALGCALVRAIAVLPGIVTEPTGAPLLAGLLVRELCGL
jgi:hypothetical protein